MDSHLQYSTDSNSSATCSQRRQMTKQVHFSELSMSMISPTVIRINCGGQLIEITRETLESYPKSSLYELTKTLRPNDEIFIDRDPYGLRTIVDYFRCGVRILYTECTTNANAEYLEKEAEFYGFDDIALKCAALYNFKEKSEVSWRPDVIEAYYPLFAKCIADPSLVVPFTFERNAHLVARCIACEYSYEPKQSHIYMLNIQEWAALKYHMAVMIGMVEKILGPTCVLVRWANGIQTHLPKTALRVVVDDI
ncbi:unnamed protein product [Bursaphelenchus okinawaensis]|uniref:BTB domain-containing protein n=1 Tax=Bursaphelenchus okinawaensis TaxID=465554 RepID=A0A811KCN2_9BILA|nr:unnamed protein product [Bursaphelenchus okinawaensis]CAG9098538.1 unnamed protein product [Bursaphelenchus okinawaensis]